MKPEIINRHYFVGRRKIEQLLGINEKEKITGIKLTLGNLDDVFIETTEMIKS